MFSPKSIERLSKIADGETVILQAIDYEDMFRLPSAMSKDMAVLLAAGIRSDSGGTNMSGERWILNVPLTKEARRILEESPVTYKHIETDKKWW